MKKLVSLVLLISIFACQQPQGFIEPEDPLDAGREFIRGILDGDFERAALYINDDIEDKSLFKRYQQSMQKQSREFKLQLKSASIIINKVSNEGDSAAIINFSNSYSKTPTDIKVIKKDNKWRIDFTYTFANEKQTK